MAKDIRVHIGTFGKGTSHERPAAWVETALTLEPEAHDLANALGSEYVRHEVTEDDDLPGARPKDLPESLTQRKILEIYRDQIWRYGNEVMGLWGDELTSDRRSACEKWLMAVVLDAFPVMKGYEL